MKLLVAESRKFPDQARRSLQQVAEVVCADFQPDALLQNLGDVDALWVRLRHMIDGETFDAAPHLQMVATPTTGLNHIDLQEAQRRRIRVISLRGETDFLRHIWATAEMTLALLLTLARRIPTALDHVRHGGWNRDLFRGNDLYGKTAGVVGYGRLGRIVAGYLQSMGMKVIAASPGLSQEQMAPGVVLAPLPEVLERADVITLHVNLCAKTTGLLGAAEFDQMKPGGWLINTARGELVDEQAFLSALESGRIAGAAVDVLADEDPTGMANHPLVEYARRNDNLLITPHIGGNTIESREKAEVFLARKVAEILEPTALAAGLAAGTNFERRPILTHPTLARSAQKSP